MSINREQLEAQLAQIARRRQIAQQMAQPMQRTQQASGMVVPYSAGEGLAQLGQAWMARRQNKKLDEQEKTAKASYETGRQGVMTEIAQAKDLTPDLAQRALDYGIDPNAIALLKKQKPTPFTLSPGDVRYDENGQQVASAPMRPVQPQGDEPFTLGPGAQRFDAKGQVIASVPFAPDKGQPPPAGYRWGASGALEVIPGGPADPKSAPTKPPTEGQTRNTLMFNSMVDSEKQIADLERAGKNADTSNLGQRVLGGVGLSVLQGDDYKQYRAAGLRWAANQLYLKSGATATPAEIESTWVQYFPQPGDGPDVIAQKQTAREQEMQSAGQAVGGAVPKFDRVPPTQLATSNAQAPQPPQGVDPETWKFMTPQERALWQ